MRKLGMLITVAGALAILAGCGGESDDEAIRTTTQDFLYAMADRDGEAACEQLTTAYIDDVLEEYAYGQQDCAAVVRRLLSFGADSYDWDSAEIDRVSIDGATATVGFVDDSSTLELQDTSEGWLISGGLTGGGT